MEEYIKQKILSVYKECKINSFPIDCFMMLKHYGFTIRTYEEAKLKDPELYEAIRSYSDDAMKFHNYVYYNRWGNIGRIRFSLMHELGHHILEHKGESKKNEDEADYFASNILAPRSIMYSLKCRNAEDVHDVFEISYSAANRAWYDYRHGYRTSVEREIKNWFFPESPVLTATADITGHSAIISACAETSSAYIPSKEFEERRAKALASIRRKRLKLQKQLSELEKDLEIIGGTDSNSAFSKAEHHYLYGNDL